MDCLIFGKELSVEFAEIIYHIPDVNEVNILGEISDKSVLSGLREFKLYYVDKDYGDGLPHRALGCLSNLTIISCNLFEENLESLLPYLTTSLSLRQLNPDIIKVVSVTDYLDTKPVTKSSALKVVTSRSVYDCLGLTSDSVKCILNAQIPEITIESGVNEVAYFDFVNTDLVPNNRGIVVSGNPEYTHMCGLNTESLRCIDRRFLRSEYTNVTRCLINCSAKHSFTLTNSHCENLLIDSELLSGTKSILDLTILIDSLKSYISSASVGYIYVIGLIPEYVDVLERLGISRNKIKEWGI